MISNGTHLIEITSILHICDTLPQWDSDQWVTGRVRWRKDLLTDQEKPRKEGMKEEGKWEQGAARKHQYCGPSSTTELYNIHIALTCSDFHSPSLKEGMPNGYLGSGWYQNFRVDQGAEGLLFPLARQWWAVQWDAQGQTKEGRREKESGHESTSRKKVASSLFRRAKVLSRAPN